MRKFRPLSKGEVLFGLGTGCFFLGAAGLLTAEHLSGLKVRLSIALVAVGIFLYLIVAIDHYLHRDPVLTPSDGASTPSGSTGISTSDQAKVKMSGGSVRGFDKGIDARGQSAVDTYDTDIEKDKGEDGDV